MSRLLILYTGGTIGMQASPDGYAPSAGFAKRLAAQLALYGEAALPAYRLVEMAPAIDSADLEPHVWNRIVEALAHHWDDHDGVVILHGTDTLAYTASALSFMLGALDKPVVLTGAQIPLGQPRSDAPGNLTLAMQSAAHPAAPREVSLAFHDRLLRGNRARKIDSLAMAAFDSPNAPWLGRAGIELQFDAAMSLPAGRPDFTPVSFADDQVAIIHCHPGLSRRRIAELLEEQALGGVVLVSYGTGNPPPLSGEMALHLTRAAARGTAIVNVTQCHRGSVRHGAYASSSALDAAGVINGQDLTPEAALTKLQVLLGRGVRGAALRDALATPLRGEMSVVK